MFQQMQALAQKQVDNILWRNHLVHFLLWFFPFYLLCFSFFQIVYPPRTSTVLSVLHWYILFLLWYSKRYFLDVVFSGSRHIQEYLFVGWAVWPSLVMIRASGTDCLSCAWHKCWTLLVLTTRNRLLALSWGEGMIYAPENMFCSIWHRCAPLAIYILHPELFIYNVM